MKPFIRFLLPDAYFYKYEHLFRILLYQFYRGNRYQCNICKRRLIKHSGQADHVRIYSVSGLTERLTDAGFYVDIRKFQEDSNNFYGFKINEVVLIARK